MKGLKKIAAFNKENSKNPTVQITKEEIRQTGGDRAREISNANLKKEAEDYKNSLDDRQDLFNQFEETKKQVGIDKAKGSNR